MQAFFLEFLLIKFKILNIVHLCLKKFAFSENFAWCGDVFFVLRLYYCKVKKCFKKFFRINILSFLKIYANFLGKGNSCFVKI